MTLVPLKETEDQHELMHQVSVGNISTTHLLAWIEDLLSRDGSLCNQVAVVGSRELHARSLSVTIVDKSTVSLLWNDCDDEIGSRVLAGISKYTET